VLGVSSDHIKEIDAMNDTNKYIQSGFTTVTPYLYAKLDFADFIKNAFGAEITTTPTPDSEGKFHAEANIGDAHLLFGNGYFSDPSMAAAIYLYVPDVDETCNLRRQFLH